MNQEKSFFLPTNICNNQEYIQRNQKNFERNFVRADNSEGNKTFQKHQYISSRPAPTGLCFPQPKPIPKECTKLNNLCSDYSKVVNQESDLYRLYNYDTKCPKLKMKLKYIDNPSFIPENQQKIENTQPVVGIVNPYGNLTQNSIFGVNTVYNKNVIQSCSDSSRMGLCDFDNYLQGKNAAAAQSDIRNSLSKIDHLPNQFNKWRYYLQLSNASSNIEHQPIKTDIINYQYPESNPYMLEDVGVIKKPDSNIQPCENLFNNMSKRKCLVQNNTF